MKLLHTTKEQLVFQLANREQELLRTILGLYPRIPPAHHQLSKSAAALPHAKENQRLLDEALAEQRAESQKKLRLLLEEKRRLAQTHNGWQLTLTSAELEWLLQVLNDIRVGSWLALGSPEEPYATLNEETAPHLWAMEVAGSFQMGLLHLLEHGEKA